MGCRITRYHLISHRNGLWKIQVTWVITLLATTTIWVMPMLLDHHLGNSACVNGTSHSLIFYPDPDDDDVSVDSCVITQDDTPKSTTSNSFVNDDTFETKNTTNSGTRKDSIVNDNMEMNNCNIHEATSGDTEILEDLLKYSQDSYRGKFQLGNDLEAFLAYTGQMGLHCKVTNEKPR